jgi:hypothetical protein
VKDSNPEATQLAQELFDVQRQLRGAGRALHDHGGLLSSAGLRLQLLRMDLPETRETVAETLALLEQALESIRGLSQELNSSPAAHLGLRFSYTASACVPPDAAVAIYEAIGAMLREASQAGRARLITISIAGTQRIAARLSIGGWKWPRRAAAAQIRRALPAGVVIRVTTKRDTIVSIRYAAARRPSRR